MADRWLYGLQQRMEWLEQSIVVGSLQPFPDGSTHELHPHCVQGVVFVVRGCLPGLGLHLGKNRFKEIKSQITSSGSGLLEDHARSIDSRSMAVGWSHFIDCLDDVIGS